MFLTALYLFLSLTGLAGLQVLRVGWPRSSVLVFGSIAFALGVILHGTSSGWGLLGSIGLMVLAATGLLVGLAGLGAPRARSRSEFPRARVVNR